MKLENSNYLVHDQWLSNILQRDVYRLTVDDNLLNQIGDEALETHNLLKELKAKPVFIYAKVSTKSLAAIKFLEDSGFNLVDTNIVFDKPIEIQNLTGEYLIRFAVPEDQDMVVELARKSFIYSRFHLDPCISSEIANTVKGEWVRNYFLGKRGDQMVIASTNGVIEGFVQLLYGQDKTLTIDLVAVDPKHRRKGIAGDMITYSETECKGFDQIQVGTQIANIPSMRLYEKLGFRVSSAHYVFHYHNI
jgi:ribosomal protein S18 acetylase RimI-like enzyme